MVLKSQVTSIDNQKIEIHADSVCIHGDNPSAFDLAVEIKQYLKANQVQIKALK
jgi:UPF0271 protein